MRLLALVLLVAGCPSSPEGETDTDTDTDTDADTGTDTDAESMWEVLPPLPSGGAWPAVAAVDGVVHVFPSNSTEHYALVEGAWESRSANPRAAHYRAAAALDGAVHLVGGGTPGAMDAIGDHDVYDPEADAWSSAEPMLTPRGYLVAEAVGGELFAMSGPHVSGEDWHVLSEGWSPYSGAWSRRADLPARWMLYSANIVHEGALYRLLGGTNNDPDDRAWRYDPGVDAWTPLATGPSAIHGPAGAALDGKLLSIGGYWEGLYLDEVWVYDPGADAWSEGPVLPREIAYSSGVTVDGCAYTIGGHHSVDADAAAVSVLRLCDLE